MFDDDSLQAKNQKYKEVTKTTYKQSISTEVSGISVDLYTLCPWEYSHRTTENFLSKTAKIYSLKPNT